jgi:hypothetical protein
VFASLESGRVWNSAYDIITVDKIGKSQKEEALNTGTESVSAFLRSAIEALEPAEKNGYFQKAITAANFEYRTFPGTLLVEVLPEPGNTLVWRLHLVDTRYLVSVDIYGDNVEVHVKAVAADPKNKQELHRIVAKLMGVLNCIKQFNFQIDTGLYAALTKNWQQLQNRLMLLV